MTASTHTAPHGKANKNMATPPPPPQNPKALYIY